LVEEDGQVGQFVSREHRCLGADPGAAGVEETAQGVHLGHQFSVTAQQVGKLYLHCEHE
jgi:hypothetical protein